MKKKLISKFMTSQPGKKTTEIRVLLFDISRNKGNQTMKLTEFIKYNMRNIFLKNHTPDVVVKLFPDTFLKNQN